VARVSPAALLERAGRPREAEKLRRARWAAAALRPALRPSRAVRLTNVWLSEPRGRRAYRVLSEDALRATRRSDTVFVFGSGRSLRDVSEEEWRRVSECDTVGFSHFHRQRWVRVDYHLVAEVLSVEETAASIAASPCYADTIFGVMRGWIAEASNDMVARRLLPTGSRIFRWRRTARGLDAAPSDRLDDGLVHGVGTIQDAVNFALVLGWRRVVIAGVDLYNKEYFWLPPGTTHEREDPWVAAGDRWVQADAIVATMGRWREHAAARGVDLYVHDERSLLSRTLPVFAW
jgi:hypothetical protein